MLARLKLQGFVLSFANACRWLLKAIFVLGCWLGAACTAPLSIVFLIALWMSMKFHGGSSCDSLKVNSKERRRFARLKWKEHALLLKRRREMKMLFGRHSFYWMTFLQFLCCAMDLLMIVIVFKVLVGVIVVMYCLVFCGFC